MAKSKLSLENSSLNWSDKRRYKVNAIVSYSGSTYQNLTGKNSEPGVGSDWFKVPDTTGIGGPITTDAVTNNSNVAGTTATDALNTLDTKIPKDYAKIVYVNNNNPNSATIFDLNNPPTTNDPLLEDDDSNLYIGLDESSWVYNSVGLVYEVEVYTGKASNFYLEGTNKDAGNNKNSAIERSGTVGGAPATKSNHFTPRSQTEITELAYACSDETSALTVGQLISFRVPFAMTLTSVRISVNEAPTVSNIIVDVKENGVSIFSTLLSIDATELTSVTAATPAVISDVNLADDALITVSTTQIGSGNAGKGLKILFKGKRVY